ncbi:MAG: hypothetical protein E5X35_24555 [Mesorhizobium sp.]|uniref:hypothetical protein n=1 Tax=Mesorhizobium sp. TaxID=1871066 RepID=UPI00121289D3|nr:hypothetical protein [Mesorhizobium sp.]TIR29949.1 MAG: hypothetical protein E5X35_24555 [Mesorhizobium sp.]
MATKMNWQRTQPGRGGFDERTASEWRSGPKLTELDLTTMPDRWSADLLLPPTIYWSVNLARAFPEADEAGHQRLRQAAITTAAAVYKSHGINRLLSRSLALYERASRSKPFPSAYFALYFDLEAMKIALNRRFTHDPLPRRNLSKFYRYVEVMNRSRCCWSSEDDGFNGLMDRMLGAPGKIRAKGFSGP